MSYVAKLKLKVYELDSMAASARLNRNIELLRIINDEIADTMHELKQAEWMEAHK